MLASCVAQGPQAQVDYVTAYYEALAAYERSDYDAALRMFKQLAAEGDALSQLYVGSMHERGEGVPQNVQEAIHWYQMSSEQGNVDAQINLAELYSAGDLIPQDLVQAYVWWTLAAAQGEVSAQKSRLIITEKMTAEQITAAQRVVDRMHLPNHSASSP
jgi:TPR repeat protein